MSHMYHLDSCFPINALVCYRNAVFEFVEVRRYRLISTLQVALYHNTDDIIIAVNALAQYVFQDKRLLGMILERIAVTAIDEDLGAQFLLLEARDNPLNADPVEVRPILTSPEHDMNIGIPRRLHDRCQAVLIDADEAVGMGC